MQRASDSEFRDEPLENSETGNDAADRWMFSGATEDQATSLDQVGPVPSWCFAGPIIECANALQGRLQDECAEYHGHLTAPAVPNAGVSNYEIETLRVGNATIFASRAAGFPLFVERWLVQRPNGLPIERFHLAGLEQAHSAADLERALVGSQFVFLDRRIVQRGGRPRGRATGLSDKERNDIAREMLNDRGLGMSWRKIGARHGGVDGKTAEQWVKWLEADEGAP